MLRIMTLLGFLAAAAVARADDKEKLQGKWLVVELESGGQKVPKEDVEKLKLALTFKDDKVHSPSGDPEKPDVDSYTLDDDESPKQIDIKDTKSGKVHKGIYSIEGNTLKLCVAEEGDRPTEFKTKEGTKVGLMVLKKAE